MLRNNILKLKPFVRKSSGKILSHEVTSNAIKVKLEIGGHVKDEKYDHFVLRDASKSETSVDPVSSQKLFNSAWLLKNPCAPKKVEIVDGANTLHIEWNDGDTFTYTAEYLNALNGPSVPAKKYTPFHWNKESLERQLGANMKVDYHSYMNPHDDKVLFETLRTLDRFGIALVTDIPDEATHNYTEWAVGMIAERIGHIRPTFYGHLFDVKNMSGEANNIAYTTKPLPLHMDLLYLENIPGFQFLHCIKNSAGSEENGVNYFVDSLGALEYVRNKDPSVLKALETIPISYHYSRDDKRYYQQRPLIEHKAHETVVNYSPPFQGPFVLPQVSDSLLLDKFKKGLALFEEFVENPQNQFTIKLPENSCVIFHNRRILHARKEFEGERWLKGCYLDADTFSSRLTSLSEKFDEDLSKAV